MDTTCIRHTDLPGTSRLFADFCYHFDRVARFYRHNPASFPAAAAEVRYPDARRAGMASVLAAQNATNAAGPKLVERFAQPGAVAVVTGQQVGLFTGPSYTIYKALTAARLAGELTASGIPAVPVFWLATEDHDFAEAATTWVFDLDRNPVRLDVSAPVANGRLRPVGTTVVEAPPIEALREALGGFPSGDAVVGAVQAAYRPGISMGEAFRELLVNLLGSVGILTLDPLDPAVRAIGAPLMEEALKAAPALKTALLDRNRELVDAGYHAQVLVEPKTSIFFLLENGERVTLRLGDKESASLRDRASDVSPNALLRPVWQDYLLPTAAYVGGPAELAYLAQSQVLYDRLLGRMPVVVPRVGFTLLDARAAKLLDRYGLNLADTLVREESLRERIAQTLAPPVLTSAFEKASANIAASLDHLDRELRGFDPTLSAALGKSRLKIQYQVEKTRRKVERETLRRDDQASADARHLARLLYPHGHLQERFYSILPFLAQHGLDLRERLYNGIERECPDHRIAAF